jgi:20S proteasome subunit alpha 2
MSYNYSLTTFSPTGELGQIKYAINAVNGGTTSIAIKCKKYIYIPFPSTYQNTGKQGIILATEKKSPSILVDSSTIHKVYQICDKIGAVYSGMGPDARILVQKARKVAHSYFMKYHEQPPLLVLVKEVAGIMQEYTQSG